MRIQPLLASALLFAIAWAPGQQGYDFADTNWVAPEVTAKAAGSAKGIGKIKSKTLHEATVTLLPGDLWEAQLDGEVVASGSYTRKDITSRKLVAELSAEGTAELEDWIDDTLEEAAAGAGVGVDTTLMVTGAKVLVSIATNSKDGTATAKFKASFKFAGTTDGEGEVDAPSKGTLKFSGTTEPIPLEDILRGVISTGGKPSVALGMYQNDHQVAYADLNGDLFTTIIPTQLQAFGGSPLSGYTFTLTTGTSLPFPGLSIDPLTGLISGTLPPGTPAATHVYDYSVTVSDGSKTFTAPEYFTVFACDSETVGAPDPDNCFAATTVNAGSGVSTNINVGLGPFKAGKAFGYSLFVNGGQPPYHSWTVLTGSLPPGLTLDAARGVIYGTPFSSAKGNTYVFTVGVSDQASTFPGPDDSQATYSLTIE